MKNLLTIIGAKPPKVRLGPGKEADLGDDESPMDAPSMGFKTAATEAFDAIKSKDEDAFADALKQCISLAHR